jgi:hypothetical protein
MRTWIFTLCCAVSLQLAAPAFASDNAGDGSKPGAMSRQELQRFVGSYQLENGAVLRTQLVNKRFSYELDGMPQGELTAVGPNSFVDASGKQRIAFTQTPNGIAYRVVLTSASATPAVSGQR